MLITGLEHTLFSVRFSLNRLAALHWPSWGTGVEMIVPHFLKEASWLHPSQISDYKFIFQPLNDKPSQVKEQRLTNRLWTLFPSQQCSKAQTQILKLVSADFVCQFLDKNSFLSKFNLWHKMTCSLVGIVSTAAAWCSLYYDYLFSISSSIARWAEGTLSLIKNSWADPPLMQSSKVRHSGVVCCSQESEWFLCDTEKTSFKAPPNDCNCRESWRRMAGMECV